ncbi:hypothetical protein OHR68_17390 [Spirillospora sp. NBC_00431]
MPQGKGELKNPENDALTMTRLAKTQGYAVAATLLTYAGGTARRCPTRTATNRPAGALTPENVAL